MATKLTLPLLSLLVFYTIFYTFEINGASKLVKETVATGKLPASDASLRQTYTGIAPLDRLLTILVIFFWPLTDGSNLSLVIHSIGFSGTFGSAWVLITLESWRRGNAWKLVAFPMVFGLVAQAMTIAFAAPLYFAVQLFSSATAVIPTAENVRVPRAVLKAIPLVFVVGYMVPTGLMLIPVSDNVTPDLKQVLIALWQPWPAYVSILLTFAHLAFSPFTANDSTLEGSRATLRSLRWVYAFAFANTALTHIISWVIPLTTVAVPWIFKEEFLQPLHPLVVFDIPKPWGAPVLVEDVGAGVHAFLRWDYIISSTATLIWALSLYRAAHRVVYGRVRPGCVVLLAKIAALTALTGPVGAAVELLWERDELVFNELGGSKRTAPAEKKVA
ncbi:uncharacterized protein DSM5745_08709 [Aspergillus mulundensis]|uniref:AtmA protein n=1 Tax=Aspergillus mulundensis TaxID=1810919 RepID=A0A3D8R4K3_9EURO|nr:Uncharacterized protein DSM5745_08709 [Aspergillus mulundensis]RDW68949.1 Uncharacterized protein DSM5745_08709 [Aspergillus mulundensis]